MGSLPSWEMVPSGSGALRAARARALAPRHPQAAEVLELVAAALDFLGDAHPSFDDLPDLAARLAATLRDRAPEPLRDAVPDVPAYFQNPDPFDPASFYSRLVLEPWARHTLLQNPEAAPNECPRCGHAPQLGVLRPEGNGDALFLACSLCRQEWPFRRSTCPQCGQTDAEKLTYFTAAGLPHVRTQTCQSCQTYLHLLLPEKDLALIPEIDELSLLAVDVWAMEQGLQKIWPNLAGV